MISHRCLDDTAASEATAFGVGQKYLIRDHDGKFDVGLVRVAKTSVFEILTTPSHAPRANAICGRFHGSVRREWLDHLLILHEKQLHRVQVASTGELVMQSCMLRC